MFCANCGNELNMSPRFCPYCGAGQIQGDSFSRGLAPATTGLTEIQSQDMVLASRGSRVTAWLCDLVVGISPYVLSYTLAFFVHPVFWALYFAIAISLVTLQSVLLVRDGQTIGKKWLNIRIVKVDTAKNGGFVTNVLLRAIVNGLLAYPTLGIYLLIDILLIFREDKRCIHDLIAGTQVVAVDQ